MFLTGGYSEESAFNAAKLMPPGMLLMHEPSTFDFWYMDSGYVAAHDNATFPPLPPKTSRTPNTIYFKETKGPFRRFLYEHVITHWDGIDEHDRKIPNLATHEAAAFIQCALPDHPTRAGFNKVVDELLNPPMTVEKERSGKLRHVWSTSGVKRIGGVDHGLFKLMLKAVMARGLL